MSKTYPEAHEVAKILKDAQVVLVVQADNPDADSIGSALALEEILSELGKETVLYCAVDVPQYLRYLKGWDRISNEWPNKFDVCLIVDVSTLSLLTKITEL